MSESPTEGLARVRTMRLSPYRKGLGPVFTLQLFDGGRLHNGGPQWAVGYRLTMKEPGKPSVVVFDGADYGCSPLHAIDSDESVAGLLSFLCLRPGDTDPDYFKDYTRLQMYFALAHGESVLVEAMGRLGEEAFA